MHGLIEDLQLFLLTWRSIYHQRHHQLYRYRQYKYAVHYDHRGESQQIGIDLIQDARDQCDHQHRDRQPLGFTCRCGFDDLR